MHKPFVVVENLCSRQFRLLHKTPCKDHDGIIVVPSQVHQFRFVKMVMGLFPVAANIRVFGEGWDDDALGIVEKNLFVAETANPLSNG